MTESDRDRKHWEETEHDMSRSPFLDDERDESAAEIDLEQEQDVNDPDNDEGLLNPESPEFEHLRRKRRDKG